MNFTQTFSILFWLNRSKANSKGLVPIWVRITVDGRRAECSIQKQILPGLWDSGNNKAKGNSSEARSINDYLVMVQAEITKHYNILSTKDVVTVEDVKNSYRGIKEVKKHSFNYSAFISNSFLNGMKLMIYRMAGIRDFRYFITSVLNLLSISSKNQRLHLMR